MRTLKKTLCLVLCLAMMAGLCVIGTSAAFTDADEIQNKEAVDLMAALGIIEGYPDGDFQPAKIFNRAEAAKIVAYLTLGAEAAETLPEAKAFDDVPASHWASKYVAYCKSQGIIAGKSETKFDPSGELTAAAWAKMLLCALGYDAEAEGLVGSSWDFNVTKLVSKTKLADGMAFSASAPMSRDNAALLACNALTVPMVAYDGGTHVSTSDGTTVDIDSTRNIIPDAYLCELYGLQAGNAGKNEQKDGFSGVYYKTGVITANGANAADASKTVLDDTTTYTVETGAELLGHYVKLFVVNGKVYSVTDIGTTVTVASKLTKKADVTAAFGKDGGKVDTNGSVLVFGDGKLEDLGDYKIANDTAAAGTYVFNPDGELVAELLDTYAVTTLNKVNDIKTEAEKESITLSTIGNLDNNAKTDVVREYEGIAKFDVVIAAKCGAIYTLTKAETVEGKISKVDSKGNITLDGTVYAKSAVANKAGLVDATPATAAEMKGNTYTLYLDAKGAVVVCAVKEAAVAPFEAYYLRTATLTSKSVLQADNSIVTKFYAEVINMAGEKLSVEVEKAGAVDAALEGKFVTVNAVAGKDYKKIEAATNDAAEAAKFFIGTNASLKTAAATNKYTFNTTSTAIPGGTAALRVNAETSFLFVSVKDGATVVEKKAGLFDMKDAAGAIALFVKDADDNYIAKTVVVGGAYTEAVVANPSTTVYVKAGTVWSENTVDGYVYTVYDAVKGEAKQITMATATELAGKEGFYTFSTNSKGITTVSAYAISDDTVAMGKTYDGKYETSIVSGTKEYATDNAIFVDLRAAADIETKVTSLDTLNTEDKINGNDVALDMLLNSKGAPTIIFVKIAP